MTKRGNGKCWLLFADGTDHVLSPREHLQNLIKGFGSECERRKNKMKESKNKETRCCGDCGVTGSERVLIEEAMKLVVVSIFMCRY